MCQRSVAPYKNNIKISMNFSKAWVRSEHSSSMRQEKIWALVGEMLFNQRYHLIPAIRTHQVSKILTFLFPCFGRFSISLLFQIPQTNTQLDKSFNYPSFFIIFCLILMNFLHKCWKFLARLEWEMNSIMLITNVITANIVFFLRNM